MGNTYTVKIPYSIIMLTYLKQQGKCFEEGLEIMDIIKPKS